MCDPVSLTVVGAGIAAGGAIEGGMAASEAGRGNAAALRNQVILRNEKAKFDTEAENRKFTRVDGSMRNQIAASGVSTSSFSDVLNDSLAEKALALEAIKWGAKNDANNLEYQAQSAEKQASQSQTASFFKAGSAVVGGGASYYQSTGLGKTKISSQFE